MLLFKNTHYYLCGYVGLLAIQKVYGTILNSIAPNVLRLVAERDLEEQCFNLALLSIKTTNDECSTSALFATNRCYVLGGLSALNLILKRNEKISFNSIA
jgi:hypothetical protein